jgi:hypothetical protein
MKSNKLVTLRGTRWWVRDPWLAKDGAMVILGEPRIDKASKFLLAALCPDRTSRSVNEATVSLFYALHRGY